MPDTTTNTNIDVEALARSPLVRAFMIRTLDEDRDPLTGHIFPIALAKRAADAFDLYHADGTTFARALVDVAAQVIALQRACARFDR